MQNGMNNVSVGGGLAPEGREICMLLNYFCLRSKARGENYHKSTLRKHREISNGKQNEKNNPSDMHSKSDGNAE